jgi:lysophospholipase L1-like esterase
MSNSPFSNLAAHNADHEKLADSGYAFPLKKISWADRGNPEDHANEQVFFNDAGLNGCHGFSDGSIWRKNLVSHFFNGRVVENLFPTEYISDVTNSITAGTGTPTITEDDTEGSFTIELAAGLTGRAFKAFDAISFVAGHTYCLSFEITDLIKPTSGTNILDVVSAPTVDFGSYQLTRAGIAANTRQAVVFQPTTTQSVTFRLGFGISGNTTGAATTGSIMTVKNIMIEDLSDSALHIPSTFVPPLQSAIINADYYGALAAVTAGALTVSTNVIYPHNGLSIAIFGDSYTNDTIDYPQQLQALSAPKVAVWYQPTVSKGVTVSGTRPGVFLGSFTTKMQALIDAGQKPRFVLLQSSLNTINVTGTTAQDTAITDDLAVFRSAAEWALNNGIQPIFTNITAWKAGCATWISDTKYHAQQRFDSKIYGLAAELDCPVFNLRKTIEDAAIPYQIAAAYDNGDGVHPNATGSLKIATDLQAFLVRLLGV